MTENRWIAVAIFIMLLGVVAGMLHQLDVIPLWAGTLGLLVSAAGALAAAFKAARVERNESNG